MHFNFTVLPEHCQDRTYLYLGTSLHDVLFLTTKLHNIFVEFSRLFWAWGGGVGGGVAWLGMWFDL
jgi:hypothetical protein